MAKSRASVYFCQNCGYESSKWMGQCPGCREWNTFVEEKAPELPGGSHAGADPKARPVKLGDIEIREEDRISTGMKELDRVLGGGIVPGSLVLVGGDPGIGKSTLLLQVCCNLSHKEGKILYISGEESLKQTGSVSSATAFLYYVKRIWTRWSR